MKFELLLLILAVLLPWQARAAAGFTYEGYLTDDHDEPVGQAAAVTLPMTFEILGDNGGTLCVLYTEARNVPVSQGHFAVRVGGPSAQTSNLYGNANFGAIFSPKILAGASSCSFDPNAAGAVRKLRVTVNGTQMGAVVLSSAPTAMVAEQIGLHTPKSLLRVEDSEVPMPVSALSSAAFNRLLGFATDGKTYLTTDSSLDAAKITGTVANATNAVNATTAVSFSDPLGGDVTGNQSATTVTGIRGRAISNSPPANDQVLQWDAGANSWTPKTLPATGTGTVTSISTGLGLTGGPINGSGTISVATGGIGTIHLADSSVTSAKIADGTIATEDLGDAQVTDAKIAGVGVEKIASNSGQYFSYKPNGASCADGQILKWDDGNTRWICASPLDSVAGAPLDAGKIWVGNATGKAQPVLPSGDATISPTGLMNVTGLQGRGIAPTGPGMYDLFYWSGSQWGPVSINGDLRIGTAGAATIQPNAVTSAKIADGAITPTKIASNSIGSLQMNMAPSMSTNDGLLVRTGTQFYPMSCAGNQTLVWNVASGWTCSNVTISEADPKINVGTLNALAKWDGARLIAGNIFENSGKIGIGISSPSAILETSGDALINGVTIGKGGGSQNASSAFGASALTSQTTGNYNTAIGFAAMQANSTGSSNTAVGAQSLGGITSSSYNTALGYAALSIATGSSNTALGSKALQNAGSGSSNTSVGANSGFGISTGAGNVFLGSGSGSNVTTGNSNVFLGSSAGAGVTTGSNNVIIGSNSGSSIASSNNNILIADGSGAERIRVDASGNVGIGTTSPSERLDLGDGNIKMGYSRGSCGFTRAATGTQTYTCTCSNPSSFIVSGGCKTDNVSYLFDSYPVSNTSWACTYSFSSSGTTNISIWTVCANIR